VTIDRARASLSGQYQAIINGVEAAEQKGMSEATLVKFKAKVLTLENGSRGQSDVHTEAQAPLTLLLLGHRRRAAHRVREHRQPAAGAVRRRGPARWPCGGRSARAARG
jgi:hypothetical protein